MYTLHLCDKVCQWLAPGWWFSLGTPVSSTNKTNCHDITEILLNMSLNIINHYDLRQSFVITEKYCNHHLYICMLIHQTVKLYRKLDVLSELEYTLNFHFNLDSDTDPNYIHDIHEGTIHYIGTCSEETNGKKFVTFCLSFLSNFAICHSEIMHDAKC
jgi:hypothetical protein